ncbi:putative signal peptide peptidase SppA [Caldalkalibacillus thermarum]|uniref:signal peptide peptidase SppA n=1 Tax=Caldalkalibacillus thermarum TaxID=296745 RepID=UPI00166DBF07|nr:signal peptide peptidase SppA [Caldalkalibacillus thermarum]GGK12433.1 putative signal peptide peptidase SppA [Caldalkalibacillus thermarum]
MSRKRWIALGVFVILFLFYAFFQTIEAMPELGIGDQEWKEEVYQFGGLDRIALLEVEGVILDQTPGAFFTSVNYNHRLFLKQLKHAFEDKTVGAVVMRVNSPGGGIVESDEIFHTVLKLKEEHDKPFVVYMGNMAASGGYYISAPADKIVANRHTITGSIGVIINSYSVQELAERWGIRDESVTSGPYKDILSSMKEMTDEERAILQGLVDEAYENFVDAIVQGRGLDRNKVLQLADGRIYSGQQAKELGLVDELGFLDDAIDQAADLAGIENPTVITYKTGWSAFNTLFARFSGVNDWLGVRDMIYHQPTPNLMYLLKW